jgi:hypothetical protein
MFGASRYLNKMTGYAAGFRVAATTLEAGKIAYLFGETADAANSGVTAASSLISVSATTDYDVTPEVATLVAGVTGKYKLSVKSQTCVDDVNGNLVAVCGTSALMSGLGTVSTDAEATTLC